MLFRKQFNLINFLYVYFGFVVVAKFPHYGEKFMYGITFKPQG